MQIDRMPHPLKSICLVALSGLVFCQLSLFLIPVNPLDPYWIILLTLPLLLPYKGLISDRLYTYKWIGFLCLFYFSVGISELVSNPELKIYAYLTTIFSTVLFVSSIYYSRYLRFNS
jgi:uncharacterized membrane protein